jgi:hypothetical protein
MREQRIADKTIAVSSPLHLAAGTISFWVKPAWDIRLNQSHTLLSARWQSSASYFALSQGWWEPQYADRLLLIVSNEQQMGCSARYKLPTNTWLMVTAVWQGGDNGYCKLFVDDQLLASSIANFAVTDALITNLNVGSDSAATDQRGRVGLGIYGPVLALDQALSDSDVIRKYRMEEWQATDVVADKKWRWTNARSNQASSTIANDSDGYHAIYAIFDEDGQWATSPAAIDNRLNKIKAAGFNVYFPCVWHGQGTRYRSSFAAPEEQLSAFISKGWDPLAYAVIRAHAMGLEIHPWFTVALRDGERFPEFVDPGAPTRSYDVHNKKFREFIAALVLDVVDRYDIDGINLDYIRSMGICKSDSCVRDYRNKTGAELLIDAKTMDSSTSARLRLQRWMDADVEQIVSEISTKARKLKPGIVVSIDSFVEPDQQSRVLEGRDDIGWTNRNLIDAIFHMDYGQILDVKRIVEARALLRNPNKLIVLIANYNMVDGIAIPRDTEWIDRVSRFVLRQGLGNGVGVYQFNHLVDAQVTAFANGPFRTHLSPKWAVIQSAK